MPELTSGARPGRRLFNGRNLDGWEHVGKGGFLVERGALCSQGGMGLLWYQPEAFGDCLLRVEYRTHRPEDNSGVYVRIDGEPPDPWHAVHRGYEVQILASGDEWHRSGVIYTMRRTCRSAERPPGEWNTMEIALSGLRIAVWLNGEQTADFHPRDTPPTPATAGSRTRAAPGTRLHRTAKPRRGLARRVSRGARDPAPARTRPPQSPEGVGGERLLTPISIRAATASPARCR